MNAVSLVLAAGKAERFGSAKQLAFVDGTSLLNRAVAAFDSITPNKVIVVLGARYDLIAPTVTGSQHCVFAKNWAMGMSSSIKVGLTYALSEFGNDLSHVAIGLGDQIDVTEHQLNKLENKMHSNPDSIVAAKYNDTLGAPAIFPRQYFNDLLSLKAKEGAKSLIARFVNNVKTIDMPEANVDIDTVAELEQWQQSQNNR